MCHHGHGHSGPAPASLQHAPRPEPDGLAATSTIGQHCLQVAGRVTSSFAGAGGSAKSSRPRLADTGNYGRPTFWPDNGLILSRPGLAVVLVGAGSGVVNLTVQVYRHPVAGSDTAG